MATHEDGFRVHREWYDGGRLTTREAVGRGVQVTGKVFKEGGRVADKAGQNLGKTGDLHEEADLKGRDGLLKNHPEDKTRHLTGGSTRTASAVSTGGKESDPKKLHGGGEHTGSEGGEGSGGTKDKAPPKIDSDDHRYSRVDVADR